MRPFAFVTAAALSILALSADSAAAPPGLPTQALDLELKQADVGNAAQCQDGLTRQRGDVIECDITDGRTDHGVNPVEM